MQIRSIRDIPDEIKNVVELYYAGSQSAAYSEAESLRAVRKDLRELADCVLQLFEHAPGSMFAFYDSLIAVSSTSLSTEGFDFGVSNLMGDDDDGFSMLLTQSLEDDTKLPSVFTDSSDQHRSANKSFGLSGQKLSSQPPKFGTDISLDIDIDIDPSTYSDSMASAFSQKAVSSAPFSQQPPPRLTPLSDASSSSLGKAAPSIMRAAQKSLQHEDSRNAKRLAEITKPRAASSSPSGVLTPPSVPSSANQDATPLARKRTSGQADTHATVLNLTPIAVPEPHTASSRYTSASDQAATRPPSDTHATVVRIQPITQEARRQSDTFASQMRPTVVQMAPVQNERRSSPGSTGQRMPGCKIPTLETNTLCSLHPLARIPRLLIPIDALSARCDIDARTGFILSHIDGNTSLADLIDLSAWPKTETTSIILALKSQGIIAFDDA